MVKFFNLYEIAFSLSWDGFNVTKTRKCDVINDPVLRQRFLALRNLSIVGVACSYTYPLDFIKAVIPFSNEYFKKHNKHVGIAVDQIYDSNISDRTLFDIDYSKMYSQMKTLSEAYFYPNSIKDPDLKHPLCKTFISSTVSQIRWYVENQGNKNKNICSCGNGYTTHNVDLNGNLYFCHNIDKTCATIHDPYLKYLNGVMEQDTTREHRKVCEECPVYSICMGGCPLISEQVRKETYCDLKINYFYPVIETLLSIEEQ